MEWTNENIFNFINEIEMGHDYNDMVNCEVLIMKIEIKNMMQWTINEPLQWNF